MAFTSDEDFFLELMMNERHTKRGSNRSDIYQFVLQGHLSSQWSDWFDGFTITLDERGQTILIGPVTDQAALRGMLKKIRDLGITLHDAMDRLLADSFVRPWSNLAQTIETSMPIDMYEENDQLVVKTSMPGVRPEDVNIEVHDNILTITGESRHHNSIGRFRATCVFTE